MCFFFGIIDEPFLLAIPYGTQARKSLRKNWKKFKFSIDAAESAKQKLLEGLPEHVSHVSQDTMNIFLSQAIEKRLMAVMVLSEKPYPPLMVRHVATFLRKIASVGFFPNPPQGLQSICLASPHCIVLSSF